MNGCNDLDSVEDVSLAVLDRVNEDGDAPEVGISCLVCSSFECFPAKANI